MPELEVEFVIDTGFEGEITLPIKVVEALGLKYAQPIYANLADNVRKEVKAYVGLIKWFGKERKVLVLAMGLKPLLGTMLLDLNDLHIEFKENGSVDIIPLV